MNDRYRIYRFFVFKIMEEASSVSWPAGAVGVGKNHEALHVPVASHAVMCVIYATRGLLCSCTDQEWILASIDLKYIIIRLGLSNLMLFSLIRTLAYALKRERKAEKNSFGMQRIRMCRNRPPSDKEIIEATEI